MRNVVEQIIVNCNNDSQSGFIDLHVCVIYMYIYIYMCFLRHLTNLRTSVIPHTIVSEVIALDQVMVDV